MFDFVLQVVDPINKLLDTVPFDVYCYSLDWHPSDHLSFVDNVCNRKFHETSPVTYLVVQWSPLNRVTG